MANWRVEEIKKDIERQIEYEKAVLEKWQAVTFQTKKNGEPFIDMSKNIEGARYQPEIYSIQPGENRITIYTQTIKGLDVSDNISAYEIVKYMYDENKKAKTENYMPKNEYLEQIYRYDIDDIKEAIEKRIEYLEKNIKVLERQLENAEEAYNAYYKAYNEALEKLEEIADKKENATLYYAIKEAVE